MTQIFISQREFFLYSRSLTARPAVAGLAALLQKGASENLVMKLKLKIPVPLQTQEGIRIVHL